MRGKSAPHPLAQRQRRTLLAPLLGELSRQRLRGRRSGVWSRGEKTERSQTNLSLRGAKRRGNPHPLYAMCKYTAVKKEKRIPTTSVSTGLGMTVVFYTLPSLFSTGNYYQLEQSAKDAPSKNHPVVDGLRAVPRALPAHPNTTPLYHISQ